MSIATFRTAGAGSEKVARQRTIASWPGLPIAVRVASVAVVLGAWQVIGSRFSFAISYPSAIARAFTQVAVQTVVPAFGDTLATFGFGFGICVVAGIPIGLAMARIEVLRVILEPYITAFYSIPFLVLFPVLFLVFGVNFGLRVACVILMGLFPIILNTFLGARQVDSSLIDVGNVFAGSKGQMLRTIVLPASLPYVFSGLQLGFARAMIGVVVVEMEASAVGIGNLLGQYGDALEIADYFVVVLLLGLFSIACRTLLRRAERWVTMPWERPTHRGLARAYRSWRAPHRDASAAPGTRRVTSAIWRLRSMVLRRGADGRRELSERAARRVAWDRWPQSSVLARVVKLVTLAAVLGAWQLHSRGVSDAVLPSPWSIAQATVHLTFVTGSIWAPLGSSCTVLAVSFGIVVVVGIPIGLLMGRSRLAEYVVDPYISFFYALPHVALLPLMVVWLGFGVQMRITYTAFSGIFAVMINTTSGVRSIDPEAIAVGRSFCASERKILKTIVLPSVTPSMVAGARQAFSMVWVGVVVAEFLATETGIGGLITYYGNYFFTADMVVPIIFIVVIALLIVKFSTWTQFKLTPWSDVRR